MAAMLGIGVGIDYALLILTRYRAALADGASRGRDRRGGRRRRAAACWWPGMIVVISLFGLFAMGLTYLYGVALASIIAVLVVMAAAITLLPALLGFAGPRIERLRLPGPRRASGRFAGRWSRAVQRRPWTAAAAGVAVLLVLASPATGLRLGFPDAGNDRAETTTRQAFELVTRHFGEGANGPLVVVAPARAAECVAAVLDARPGDRDRRAAGAEPGRRHGAGPGQPDDLAAGRGDRGHARAGCATGASARTS